MTDLTRNGLATPNISFFMRARAPLRSVDNTSVDAKDQIPEFQKKRILSALETLLTSVGWTNNIINMSIRQLALPV